MASAERLSCFRCGCFNNEERRRRKRSREIDKQLVEEWKDRRLITRILVFGLDESWKSAFFKQMRIANGLRSDDLNGFRQAVYENIVRGMKVLVDAHRKLGIPLERDEESRQLADFVFGFDDNIRLDEPVFLQYVPAIARLWKDAGIQKTFDRRNEYQLTDSVKYFLDNLYRIGKKNYVPSNQDILHSQKATKCIMEYEFVIQDRTFLFIDVGGQRSQRQKWYHCFDDVKSILFIANSSEFDQVLYEDGKTNRLVESCDIFEAIANNRSFAEVPIILFLSQTDQLAEKVKHFNIRDSFPQFMGDPHNLSDVQKFLVEMFDQRRTIRSKLFYHHFTTETYSENINVFFQKVKEAILQQNIKMLMLEYDELPVAARVMVRFLSAVM